MNIIDTLIISVTPLITAMIAFAIAWFKSKQKNLETEKLLQNVQKTKATLEEDKVFNGQIAGWIIDAEFLPIEGKEKTEYVLKQIKNALHKDYLTNDKELYYKSKISFIVAQYNAWNSVGVNYGK